MEGESESAKPSFHWFSFVHVSIFSPVAKEVTPCFPLTPAAATKPPGTARRPPSSCSARLRKRGPISSLSPRSDVKADKVNKCF